MGSNHVQQGQPCPTESAMPNGVNHIPWGSTTAHGVNHVPWHPTMANRVNHIPCGSTTAHGIQLWPIGSTTSHSIPPHPTGSAMPNSINHIQWAQPCPTQSKPIQMGSAISHGSAVPNCTQPFSQSHILSSPPATPSRSDDKVSPTPVRNP